MLSQPRKDATIGRSLVRTGKLSFGLAWRPRGHWRESEASRRICFLVNYFECPRHASAGRLSRWVGTSPRHSQPESHFLRRQCGCCDGRLWAYRSDRSRRTIQLHLLAFWRGLWRTYLSTTPRASCCISANGIPESLRASAMTLCSVRHEAIGTSLTGHTGLSTSRGAPAAGVLRGWRFGQGRKGR